MRKINKIIIHCSGSSLREDDNLSSLWLLHVCPKGMYVPFGGKMLEGNGWRGFGYHGVITSDGAYFKGLDDEEIGRHCFTKNKDSLGYCLTGSVLNDFTDNQFKTLARILYEKLNKYDLDLSDIYPHNYFNKRKYCPAFSVYNFKRDYL